MLDFEIKKKTKLIESKVLYPNNANIGTTVNIYKCFCGEGEIEENKTSGFDDRFITINCKECLKKYCSNIDYYGNDWKVYVKDKKNIHNV